MRLLLIILLTACCISSKANDWTISYYLQGKVYDKTGKPLSDMEIILQNGLFCRKFKTDISGNYKVEVFVFLPCSLGSFNCSIYDKRTINSAFNHNDSLLKFDCIAGGFAIKSHWQKYYFNKKYNKRKLSQYIELADIYLTEEKFISKEELSSIEERLRKNKQYANSYCELSQDSLDKMIAFYLTESKYEGNFVREYDTIASHDTNYPEIVYQIIQTNVTPFHRVDDYLHEINYYANEILNIIELTNRNIMSLTDIIGPCTKFLKLKKTSRNTYIIYNGIINPKRKIILIVDKNGIIKEHYYQ